MSRPLLERYFAACSSGSVAEVMACFTRDAVIYDTNHPPVVGREAIGMFWGRVRAKWSGATWEAHTLLEYTDRAAVEWSMRGESDGRPFVARGSDHYDFADGRISQIRQYWTFDPEAPGSELLGFPYGDDPRFAPLGEEPWPRLSSNWQVD